MASDPDPETIELTRAMLDDEAELELCFGSRLQFGTAGIRGLLGPGPGRMNRALVMRVTAGLADYLEATVPNAKTRGVVIGHDARRGSQAFCSDACGVLAARGFKVYRCQKHAPTPLVAYGLLELKAACGIVVTASHNPPAYNGYKVYWDNGAQIIPPVDAGIAAAIDAIHTVPSTAGDDVVQLGADLADRYAAAVAAQIEHIAVPADAPAVSLVYTPLHGVGAPLAERVIAAQGATCHTVAEQREPDGAFPTVAFPNPEEAGALDMADALCEHTNSALILANDPDADRLSLTVRADGALRRLTGDELGVLLADALLEANRGPDPFVGRSFVSGELLDVIADFYGARCLVTLTGFKWLWNGALDEIARGGTYVFAYEEAIGYSVGSAVRDKDGLAAAALVARMARSGVPLWDRLCAIFERHGLYATRQRSLVDPTPGAMERFAAALDGLRRDPPSTVAGVSVSRARDYLTGGADLPPSNALALWLEDGTRLMLRPSGTEPKLKMYLQVTEPWGQGAERRASDRLTALARAVGDLVQTAS